jgi:hypothetical protein
MASDPAAATSEASSPTGSISSTDEDSGSSSGGETSGSVSGRPRSRGGSPRFVTYEDRLEAILDKLEFW